MELCLLVCYNRAMIEIFDTHTHLTDNFAEKEQEEIDFRSQLKEQLVEYCFGFDKPTINL